ncbi:gamma-glutamylcyclotransferase family protein [Gaetbulibacter sp. M240]|uniref:gamma-glutamylcyclotransferase family protein n=1 Tax=Gaetbulibacter sp. M240 TaxID=3126511 RepID=UPI00374E4876
MDHSAYLFVYGSLLKGQNNKMADLLSIYSEFLGEGFFNGKLYLVSWFPGAVLSDNSSDKVYGHIFKLNNESKVLSVLDDYEGFGPGYDEPYLFRRELNTVNLKQGSQVESWVYLYNLPVRKLQRIPDGNYLNFKSQ